MGPTPIVPVTAVPTVKPDHATLVGKVFNPDGGNAVEIYGHCNANSGALTLYRNHSDANGDTTTEWYPVENNKNNAGALLVDSATPTEAPGMFSKIWSTGDLKHGGSTRAWYVVLYSAAAVDLDKLYAAGRRMSAP